MDVGEVHMLFLANKRLTMIQVEPGLFVIPIANQSAFEHYEIIT